LRIFWSAHIRLTAHFNEEVEDFEAQGAQV
jgi:hypothetical protein